MNIVKYANILYLETFYFIFQKEQIILVPA